MNDKVVKQQVFQGSSTLIKDKTVQCNWFSLHRKEAAAKRISKMTDALWLPRPARKETQTVEEKHFSCSTLFLHLSRVK